MKKTWITSMLFLFASLGMAAQENIHFAPGSPTQEGLSQKTIDALKLKVEQILARNNAGATSMYNAFVIVPELTISDTRSTEGLVRDVTLVTGEFSLTARNKYDGSIYGTVAIEVSGDATGNKEAAVNALLTTIKSNNPAFLRFIRTTRQRIVEHYEQNCATIIKKAQTMINIQQFEEAAAYLESVPETVSCYTDAAHMLENSFNNARAVDCDKRLRAARGKFILRDYKAAMDLLQDIAAGSPCDDDVTALMDTIAKYIIFPESKTEVEPVILEPVITEPVITEPVATEPDRAEPPASKFRISISCSDLEYELVSCEGNLTGQTITIYGRIKNTGKANNSATIRMMSAIAPDGSTYNGFRLLERNGASSNVYGNKMPTNVKIGKVFEIREVAVKQETLSYVEIAVDDCRIIIHDLPVVWK